MPEKKKLKLDDLKVQSFVTSLDEAKKQTAVGAGYDDSVFCFTDPRDWGNCKPSFICYTNYCESFGCWDQSAVGICNPDTNQICNTIGEGCGSKTWCDTEAYICQSDTWCHTEPYACP